MWNFFSKKKRDEYFATWSSPISRFFPSIVSHVWRSKILAKHFPQVFARIVTDYDVIRESSDRVMSGKINLLRGYMRYFNSLANDLERLPWYSPVYAKTLAKLKISFRDIKKINDEIEYIKKHQGFAAHMLFPQDEILHLPENIKALEDIFADKVALGKSLSWDSHIIDKARNNIYWSPNPFRGFASNVADIFNMRIQNAGRPRPPRNFRLSMLPMSLRELELFRRLELARSVSQKEVLLKECHRRYDIIQKNYQDSLSPPMNYPENEDEEGVFFETDVNHSLPDPGQGPGSGVNGGLALDLSWGLSLGLSALVVLGHFWINRYYYGPIMEYYGFIIWQWLQKEISWLEEKLAKVRDRLGKFLC